MCELNRPLFQRRQLYDKPPFFKKESIWTPRFSFWHLNGPNFWHPYNMHIFLLRYLSILCFHIYIKKVFSWGESFVSLFTNHRGYERVYQSKEQNYQVYDRLSVSKARYMIVVGFKILSRTPVPKLPPSYPPPPPTRTNLSIRPVSSCFLLFANTKKGRRWTFSKHAGL